VYSVYAVCVKKGDTSDTNPQTVDITSFFCIT